MNHQDKNQRSDTDASLRAERYNTDQELNKRVLLAERDAEGVPQVARERADRLLSAARSAADARLPLNEQTAAAVRLLLEQRSQEDQVITQERENADQLLNAENAERRERLLARLVLERQTTDLHLALERRTADNAVTARDEFLAQASHDLRGLLGAQKLYIALLVSAVGSSNRGNELDEVIASLAKIETQMDRLICDLVDVVAMEAGKLSLAVRTHSAEDLVSATAAVYEPLARQRGQAVSVLPAAADVKVRADYERAVQVLGNLLSNAIKFTPHGGKIRLGFEPSEDEVTFFVEDTGPGIPPDRAEHIFERYVGSTTAAKGLGLGLFIAAQIVQAHGGRLWLDRNCTSGCVFRFTLKRARAR